jgi:uncharacterized protein YoxC
MAMGGIINIASFFVYTLLCVLAIALVFWPVLLVTILFSNINDRMEEHGQTIQGIMHVLYVAYILVALGMNWMAIYFVFTYGVPWAERTMSRLLN